MFYILSSYNFISLVLSFPVLEKGSDIFSFPLPLSLFFISVFLFVDVKKEGEVDGDMEDEGEREGEGDIMAAVEQESGCALWSVFLPRVVPLLRA